MKLKKYAFGTGKHKVVIAPFRGTWVIITENDNLGEFPTPQAAVDALRAGQATTPPSGVSPASLNLPPDIADWKCSDL